MSALFYKYHTGTNINRYRSDYRFLAVSEDVHGDSITKHKHIYVELDREYIKFYYYHFEPKRVNPSEEEEIFCLSLKNNSTIDYQLLTLPDKTKIRGITEEYRVEFLSIMPNRLPFEVSGEMTALTLKELLIAFFDELDNGKSDICKYSPVQSEEIRRRLYSSPVYSMIMLKFGFYKNLFAYASRKDTDITKLQSSFEQYSKVLMNGTLAEIVPGDRMTENDWLQTPEDEIDYLVALYKEHELEIDRKEDVLNFFLRKHAIVRAMRMYSPLYMVPLIGNIIAFLAFASLFILWLDNSFKATYPLLFIGVGAVSFSFLWTLVFNRAKLSMILPRLVVAVFTTWFLITMAEESLINLLDVDKLLLFISGPLVLVVVFTFILAETKQASPYFAYLPDRGKYFFKVLPVLIYAFNITVCVGIVSHSLVVSKIIKSSHAYEELVYNQKIDSISDLRTSYSDLKSRLFAMQDININSFSLQKVLDNNTDADLYYLDSIKNKRLEFELNTNSSSELDLENFIKVYDYRISDLKNHEICHKEQDSSKTKKLNNALIIENDIHLKFDSLIFISDSNKIRTLRIDTSDVFVLNDSVIGDIIVVCDNMINTLETIKSENDSYEELSKYKLVSLDAGLENNQDTTSIAYFFGFKKDPEKVFQIEGKILGDQAPITIFPYMLILQVFIVLIISIVGQLIISDKTVTEPL